MAVVFMEGFDNVNEAQLLGAKGWVNISNASASVAGRFSGQAGSVGNSSKTHAFPSSYSTIIVGCAFYETTTANDALITLMGSGGNVIRMIPTTIGPTTYLRLYSNSAQLGNTGATPFVANTWYHVEMKIVIHPSAGSVELRLNGSTTPEISGTSLDTGSTNIDAIRFTSGSSQAVRFDDLFVLDTTGSAPTNDFMGDCRIETIYPSAEGADTSWTANTGTKTSRVNDVSAYDSDTGYIYSGTPGDSQTFTLGDLSVTAGTVFAVQTNVVAHKDDAGLRTVAPILRISGTDYVGTTAPALGSGYLVYNQLYERLDPSSAVWTVATVNAMEAGVKEVG